MGKLCIQITGEDNEVLANSSYDNIDSIMGALEYVKNIINGYNLSLLNILDDDELLLGIKILSNSINIHDNEEDVRIQSKLMDASSELFVERYEDIDLNISEEAEGLIGFLEEDINENTDGANYVINVNFYDNKISIISEKYRRKFKDAIVEENPDVVFDTFSYDIEDFFFYDLEDVMNFISTHNDSSNDISNFFIIEGNDDFVWTFLLDGMVYNARKEHCFFTEKCY